MVRRASRLSRKAQLKDCPPDIPRPDSVLFGIVAASQGSIIRAALAGRLSAEEYLRLEKLREVS